MKEPFDQFKERILSTNRDTLLSVRAELSTRSLGGLSSRTDTEREVAEKYIKAIDEELKKRTVTK